MLVGDIIRKDSSHIGKLAQQIASAALAEFGKSGAKHKAEDAANRIHSILLKGIDDHLKMSLMKNVNESVDGEKLKHLSKEIYSMAEEMAYDESADGKRPVTGDQIYAEMEHLIAVIKDAVADYIHTEHMSRR